MGCGCVRPIVCPAQYIVRDFCTPQVVPVIHPVVTVNRQNIVPVPQHFIQPLTTNVVVAPQQFVPAAAGFLGGPGFGFAGRRFL
ncbi:MAG TPA: hypothetical protein GXX46_05895 [Peptococcaceae bacterium]|nr:hypothetical protein [Peptococcaceae bacterium]